MVHALTLLVDDIFITVQPALVVSDETPCVAIEFSRLQNGTMGQLLSFSNYKVTVKELELTLKVCIRPKVGILTRLRREVDA
jgi:hypothetical protein